LRLVMLMLGTNDFQSMHPHTAWHAAQGIATLVIAPPPIGIPRGPIALKFTGASDKSAGLADAYRGIAAELGCHFVDAGSITPASPLDGIHLDAGQHRTLGDSLARFVGGLPGVLSPAAA